MASTITLLRPLPDEDDVAGDGPLAPGEVAGGGSTEARHEGDPARRGALESLATWVAGRVKTDGHVSERAPDLCLHRYSQPTTFRKAAAFGVTLGVVLQGEKRLRIANRELVIDPTRLLVITRESEHLAAARTTGPGGLYLSLGLCFAPEQVARALLALSEAGAVSDGAGEVPAFVMPSDPVILAALHRLVGAIDDPVDRKVLAPLVVDEILYRLLRSPSAAAVRSGFARSDDAVRILDSMRHIRERHAEKLSVEGLARHAAMSPSHFAHRFAAVARTTPMRFLREVRLERARTLLLSNGTRAGEVATCVGFESAAHFTREFKRRYGVPPSTYLRPKSRPAHTM